LKTLLAFLSPINWGVAISRYLETMIGFYSAVVKRICASRFPHQFHQTTDLHSCDAPDIMSISLLSDMQAWGSSTRRSTTRASSQPQQARLGLEQ
jgi:hypothetical protein